MNRVDAVQDAQAAGDDHVQFKLQAQRQHARQRSSGFEQVAGALDFETDELRPPLVAARLADLGFGDAETSQVVLRKVNAPLVPVDGDVLPEIGELQAGADRVGLRPGRVVIDAVEVEQQASDRIRRPRAIIPEVGENQRNAS